MNIRESAEKDLPEINLLMRELAGFFYGLYGQEPREFVDSPDENKRFFVAEEGGIVGMLSYRDTPAKNFNLAESYYFIEDFFIKEEWRGRGIGKAMMEALEKKAKTEGKGAWVMGADLKNEKAREFYKKMGGNEFYVEFYKKL